MDMEKIAENNCLWVHSQEDDCWFSFCEKAIPLSTNPSTHNCPNCEKFIVIDYYKETLNKHSEAKR